MFTNADNVTVETTQVSTATKLHKSTIIDGKCHIFRRPNSPFYWCGFHHKGEYVRDSTKERTLGQAELFAKEWYWNKQVEIRAGILKVGGISFGKAAEHALAVYQAKVDRGELSKHYLDGLKKCLSGHVLPFFKDIPIDQINTKVWHDYKDHLYKACPTAARATLHQHKNAVRVPLCEANRKGWLSEVPSFWDSYAGSCQTKPRAWFNGKEWTRLHAATRANIKRLKDTRWARAALELHDYVLFVANTGLRVGEARNVRFCDVEIVHAKDDNGDEREALLIKNIRGKRGTGQCLSYYGAVLPYKRILARRNPLPGSREPLFIEYHRDMFNTILRRTGLKFTTGQPPARRDLMSLRHTYICFRIVNSANVFDIARNCRTSVPVIEKHYAQFLTGQMLTSINRTFKGFGTEGGA